jgi:hypothetical protein
VVPLIVVERCTSVGLPVPSRLMTVADESGAQAEPQTWKMK